MIEGVDYSFGRPPVAALKAAGKHFACRYLSGGRSSKDITFGEAHLLMAAGIAVVLVYESGANRALFGRAAGVVDANAAKDQANALGFPSTLPIYFAVDFDPTGHLAAIENYFAGVSQVLGRSRTGIYGGLKAVRGVLDLHLASYAWQTFAWSGGAWDPRAQIQQYGQTVIGGSSVDLDRATVPNYGGWGAPLAPHDDGGDLPTPQDVWTYYEMPDGRNLAQALKDTAIQVADLEAKIDKVMAKLGVAP